MLALAGLALALTLRDMQALLPDGGWWRALIAPDPADLAQITVHYSLLPRAAAALLVGAGLGFAGAVAQTALRNPAAEPATLGVSAGAFIALSAATVWAPSLLAGGRTGVAFVGGTAAGLAVLGLSRRSRFLPQTVLLAGLMISLYAGALNTLLIMLHGGLITLFIWGGGSLAAQDWSAVSYLAPRLAPAMAAGLFLIRPLAALALSDETAAALGARPALVRLAAFVLVLWIAAICTAAVGVIGFIGLAAPEIVRRFGFGRIRALLLLSPLTGALLLWATDRIFQSLPTPSEIPAGAASALLGAPLLIWLIARRAVIRRTPGQGLAAAAPRRVFRLSWLAALTLLVAAATLLVGRGLHGWNFRGLSSVEATLFWRAPRMLAAGAAAALLAIGGGVVQRLTANPMASPELLGVSAGAACGAVVSMLVPVAGPALFTLAGVGGACAVLALLLVFARRHAAGPDDLFLVGVAATTCFSAVVSALLASGDPRMYDLLRWLSGSTFLARPQDAAILLVAAALAFAALPFLARWLELAPLGTGVNRALGAPPARSRPALLAFASVLVGLSVLTVGPLSFVGLTAPHLARLCGFRRPLAELAAAAMIGCMLMMLADWLGRIVLFPDQIPAGLLATLIAAPGVFALIARRG